MVPLAGWRGVFYLSGDGVGWSGSYLSGKGTWGWGDGGSYLSGEGGWGGGEVGVVTSGGAGEQGVSYLSGEGEEMVVEVGIGHDVDDVVVLVDVFVQLDDDLLTAE